jgi:hypothetical protein
MTEGSEQKVRPPFELDQSLQAEEMGLAIRNAGLAAGLGTNFCARGPWGRVQLDRTALTG